MVFSLRIGGWAVYGLSRAVALIGLRIAIFGDFGDGILKPPVPTAMKTTRRPPPTTSRA